jgi:hypothetical protein
MAMFMQRGCPPEEMLDVVFQQYEGVLCHPSQVPAEEARWQTPGFCYLRAWFPADWRSAEEQLGKLPRKDACLRTWNKFYAKAESKPMKGWDAMMIFKDGEHRPEVLKGDWFYKTTVGSSVKMIEEAARVHATEIAKAEAQIQFNNDYASVPKTPISLNENELREFRRWAGFDVVSNRKQFSTNDHKLLAVARGLLDDELQRAYPHNKDAESVLHVGATAKDFKLWASHPGHDFWFALKEGKDTARMFSQLSAMVAAKLTAAKLPALTSVKGHSTTLLIEGVEEALRLLTKGERQRLHLQRPTSRYSRIHFRDSLYQMTVSDFCQLWQDSGAMTGEAVMFFPDFFFDEQCAPSDMYTVTRYYTAVEKVQEIIDVVWPPVLVLTPFLPLTGAAQFVEDALRQLLTTGWEVFKTWLTQTVNDSHPVQFFLGTLFDALKVVPVVVHVLSLIKPHLIAALANVRVNWKGGYENGYVHREHSWKKWLVTRRFPLGGGEYVETEVVSRIGEMYRLRFFRTRAESPVTYCIQVPDSRRTCLVADLQTAWDQSTSTLREPQYFPVLESDVFTLRNFFMQEPIGSIDLARAVTTLNHIRGGFALGSNVLVEPMGMHKRYVVPVALAVLMDVFRARDVLSMIEENEELRTGWTSNAAHWAKVIGKTLAVVATGGLAVPIYYLFRWLMEKRAGIEYIRFKAEPEERVLPALRKPEASAMSGRPFQITMPHTENNISTIKCELCRLYAMGLFSRDGVPEHGQRFLCQSAGKDPVRDVGFPAEDMGPLLGKIIAAENFHVGTKVQNEIRKVKHFIEAQMAGIPHVAEVHHIKGGPGTGKTEVIKSVMAWYKQMGLPALYVTPFSELLDDMVEAPVLGRSGKWTFDADSTWYWPRRSNVKVLFVDECTGFDWDVVRLAAAYLGADKIYLVGDNEQTALAPERGEGLSVMHRDSGVDWKTLPTHELVFNYRLGKWRTELHNFLYGYHMVPVSQEKDVPRFVTRKDYQSWPEADRVSQELVFAHASAQEMFGQVSTPGRDGTNFSVRSHQGKTCVTSAVAYTLLDVAASNVPGMLNVANSRSKQAPVYVVEGLQDDHVLELMKRLHVDSEEAVDAIWARKTEPVKLEKSQTMTEVNVILNDYVKAKALANQSWINKDSDIPDSFVQMSPGKQTEIKISGIYEFKPGVMLGFYRQFFHFCFVDALLELHPDLEERLCEMLKSLWEATSNDTVCTLVGDHKRYVPMQWAMDKLNESERIGFVQFEGAKVVAVSKGYRDHPASRVVAYRLTKNHFSTFKPKPERRVVKGLMAEQLFDPTDVLPDGRLVGETSPGEVLRFGVPRNRTSQVRLKQPEVADDEDSDGFVGVGHVALVEGHDPDWSREDQLTASAHTPLLSAWQRAEPPKRGKVLSKAVLRAGTDAYRLFSLLDPSSAYLRQSALNEAGGVQGVTRETNVKPYLEAFIFDRTKAGRVKWRTDAVYRSLNVGLGNHFNNTPEETLIAAQRLGRKGPKPKLGAETAKFAEDLANKFYQDAFVDGFKADPYEVWRRVRGAIRDAKARNYHGRAAKEREQFKGWKLTCSNKDQFKPMKSGKLKLDKPGQALLQSPATVNHEWIAWNRVQGYLVKTSLQPDVFMDDYEDSASFRRRLCEAIRDLPAGVTFGIADGEEWDSQQNEVTLHFEKTLTKLISRQVPEVEAYYEVRKELDFLMHGVFRGRTNFEKGSGFPDTKRGNTILQGGVSNWLFEGHGEKVVAIKGDDYARAQTGLRERPGAAVAIKKRMGMVVSVELGTGGEFCGNSLSRNGCYPSIVRTALKASAAKARDYKHFTAQQQAWRDVIAEWKDCGLRETQVWGAQAENHSLNTVEAAFAAVNSWAHVSRDQWEEATMVRKNPRYFLNSAKGPRLIAV